MNVSGSIALDNDVVSYTSRHYGNWSLALCDVRLIGESTNEMGPFTDDYFLCFGVDRETWYEAPYYAEGCDTFFAQLCDKLGRLQFRLNDSTSIASNILWPMHLAGRPMFRYDRITHTSRLRRFVGWPANEQRLSVDAVSAFDNQS